jgi:DNA-binding CsgD family transcriptional regulator
VWQAAAALGERDTEVLDLQLRQGLTPAELGDVLGINRNAANQLVHRVRKRFEVALKARLLWRGTRPACDELQALLVSAGVESFSAEAVKIADKHAPGCEECSTRRESRLSPAAMFGAVPLIAVPVLFKQQAAYALEGSGVPMSGSAFSRESVVSGGDGQAGDGSVEPSPETNPAASYGDGSVAPTPEEDGDGSVHPVRRGLIMAAAAVIVVVAFSALITSRLKDPSSNEVVAFSNGAPSTTAAPAPGSSLAPDDTTPDATVDPATSLDPGTTIVTVPGPTSPTSVATGPTQPPVTVAPPSSDPTGDPVGDDPSGTPDGGDIGAIGGPQAPNAPRGTFRLDKTRFAGTAYKMSAAPHLSWTVLGNGFTQHVTGPNVDGTAASGDVAICPGTINPSTNGSPVCAVRYGTYSYRLQVFGSSGDVLVDRTVTFTVSPALRAVG